MSTIVSLMIIKREADAMRELADKITRMADKLLDEECRRRSSGDKKVTILKPRSLRQQLERSLERPR
jgi:hypothetical protein